MMKHILTILFFIFFHNLHGQSQSSGYVLSRPDGTPILKAGSLNDSLFESQKQAALVSGTSIKTINNISLLGSGNIAIAGGEAFPVGSVFLSVVSTNPATLLGYGTWVQIAGGRMLVGQDGGNLNFDVAEETGGNSSVTITAGNLPQLSVAITDPGHNHVITELRDATTGGASTNIALTLDATSTTGTKATGSRTTGITATANTGGANTALNIQNPYFVVYVWKRTN